MFVNVNGAQIVGNCSHSKWETYNKEAYRNLKLTTHYSLLRIQEERRAYVLKRGAAVYFV